MATLAVALAFAIRALLDPLVQAEGSFLLLSAAVLVGAVYGGFWPGVFATLLAAVLGDYFFLPPVGTFVPPSLEHGLATGLFLTQALAISAIGAWLTSARRRTQGALRSLNESEQRYRLLVESVEDYAIFTVDTESLIADWNSGAEHTFGYREEEIVGQPFSTIFTPEDVRQGAPEQELSQAMAEERGEDERWYLRKDGSRFRATGFVRPVKDEEGNLRGFSKVAHDITERKQAEEQARFLADMNRELQPLTDPDEVMAVTARLLGEHLGADRCAYAEVEADEDHFRITGDYARDVPSIVGRFAISQFGAEALRLMRTNQPYVVDDTEADERLDAADLAIYRQTQIRAVACVPLHKAGRLASGMAVHQKTPRRWSREEVELVATVTNRCWESIERARAVRNLRRSEERYRSLVMASTSIVWSFDPEGRFAQPQLSWEAYTGQPWEEHRGFGWIRALYPDDRECVREIWDRARDRCSLYESEGRLWHAPSGTYRYIVARATPILDTDGSVREWIGMVTDVDDQNRAEQAVRFLAEASEVLSSSLDYRETLASLARLVVPTLADWCAVDVIKEDGALETLAVAHEDPQKVALAQELQERYPPDPDSPYGLPQVLRTGESELVPEIPESLLEEATRDEEYRELVRELGLTSYMVVPLVARGRTLGAISLVAAESGRRYGQADLGLAEDLARRAAMAVDNARLYEEAQMEIDERERAEEALKESEERFRSLVQYASDIIMVLEACGTIRYESPAIERILGYQPDERVGTNAFDHLHPDDLGSVRSGFAEFTDEPGAQRVMEYRVRHKGGSWRYLEAIGTNLLDDPVVGGIVVNSRDVTERKRAEEALREVRDAERKRMARDLHDGALQELTYALAEVQIAKVLSKDPELGDRLERGIDALRSGAQGLRDAVYDLRLGEERDESFPESVRSLVDEVRRRMNTDCDVRLEMEEGYSSPPLGEAGTELLRIVQEALNNVRRHSAARNVLVRLGTDEDVLLVEVSDDGRGFEQMTAPGVGLRSMRERAAALGARLEVESEPGKGTRVRLRAPLRSGEGQSR